MDDETIIEGILEEVEKACSAFSKRENIFDINKADKILISILNGNSKFCFTVSFRLLNSKKDTVIKEFAAHLLYHTIKSTIEPKNYDKVSWDWVEDLIYYIVESDSEILRSKLCRCLCILSFSFDQSGLNFSPKKLLETIIHTSITKKRDPDPICLSFFTSFADEYNQTYPSELFLPDFEQKIKLFVRDVQAHSFKILNYENKRVNLKSMVFKCIDTWLQHIITPYLLHFSLLVKVTESLLDPDFSPNAFTVIQTVIDSITKRDKDFFDIFSGILTKCLVYAFPYLTLVGLTQLNEVSCQTLSQQNILASFISFSSLHLFENIDDEVINMQSFSDSLKLMYRLTAIGSFSSPKLSQPIDSVVSPLQFWDDFFDNVSVKRNVSVMKFNFLFTELFYILIQRATLYPWILEDSSLTESIFKIRKEISSIFKKMAKICPDTVLDNIYITFKLYEKQNSSDPRNSCFLEVTTFVLSSIISVIPVTQGSLPILNDIYSSLPLLLNTNPTLIIPLFSLLGKSAKLIATVLSPVFSTMVSYVSNYIISSYNTPIEQQKHLIISCTEFVSTVLDQIDFKLDVAVSSNLIRLFGELFGLTFKKIRFGQADTDLLSDKYRKSYILMAKIVVRALSCMYLNGDANEVEVYVSNLVREVIDFFEHSLNQMSINPQPLKYKDVFLLLQIIHQISQGLLVISNSGKGALKMIFERLFDRFLFISAYYSISNSDIGIKLLIEIINKCIYKGFGSFVSKISLDNFINYNTILLSNDYWQMLPIVVTYLKVLKEELSIQTDPIDYVIIPIINTGLKNISQPNWPNAHMFFDFLTNILKIFHQNLILYNYISLESAKVLILQLLDYSQLETWPEGFKAAVKCLKHLIRCSYRVTDGNILLLSKQSHLDGLSLLEHIFIFIFNQMALNGEVSVITYYPLINELFCQNSNDFFKIFHQTLFSPAFCPIGMDSDSKQAFYWKFIDSAKEKDAGLQLMIRFFSAISKKCKI